MPRRPPDEYDETIRSDASAEAPDQPTLRPPDEGATIASGTDYRSLGISIDSSIAKKFEDITEIARGGMGVVYRARDHQLGRLVALKCLKGDTSEDEQNITRFRHEAQTIASLDHFNIVRIYNLIEEENSLWIEMEFVEGGSLQDVMARDGALPVERVVEIGKQLCSALSLAHEKGIIHRDIKPANILLTKRGSPKLADFGLARDTNTNTMFTMTGAMMGTMHYASPEQLVSGKHVDQRSDLYSLGATLYALCTGQSPRIMRLDLIPDEIRDVLTKCLEESPDNRYANAEELAVALGQSMSGHRSSMAMVSEVGCPKCGHENPVDVHFCQKCGGDLSSLFRKCPECGKESRIDIDYCGFCGTNITAYNEATEALEHAEAAFEAKQYKTAIQYAEQGLNFGLRKDELSQVWDNARDTLEQMKSLMERIERNLRENELDPIAPLLNTLESLVPQDGNDREAVGRFRDQVQSQNLAHYLQTARSLIEQKNYQQAIDQLTRFLSEQQASEAEELLQNAQRLEKERVEGIKRERTRLNCDVQEYQRAIKNGRGSKDYLRKKYQERLKDWKKAANLGWPEGQFLLGYCYESGIGVSEDPSTAACWYRKAAQAGNTQAMCKLGNLYEEGKVVLQDDEEVEKWYLKMGSEGDAEAKFKLGKIYEHGRRGVAQDNGEAVRWYRAAAWRGHAEAMYRIGWMYVNGRGVAQNDGEAIRWWRKAAAAEDAKAMFKLGVMYRNGQGVNKDEAEAVKWFRKAAEQGDADAQHKLGDCYEYGRGVNKDKPKAAKWYRMAAEQGHEKAQYELGLCYFYGRGVRKDKFEGEQWFLLAARQGNKNAKAAIQNINKKVSVVIDNLLFTCVGVFIGMFLGVFIGWYLGVSLGGDEVAGMGASYGLFTGGIIGGIIGKSLKW